MFDRKSIKALRGLAERLRRAPDDRPATGVSPAAQYQVIRTARRGTSQEERLRMLAATLEALPSAEAAAVLDLIAADAESERRSRAS